MDILKIFSATGAEKELAGLPLRLSLNGLTDGSD